jgi:Protein of unknown function (DUF1579)
MTDASIPAVIEALEPLVGEWQMAADLAPDPTEAPRASTTFEWLAGKRFLVQRWEVDHPDAPDGIALIGIDPTKGTYLQHYFDSRGVARVYDMAFANGVWELERYASDPDFSQRFTGRFSPDGDSIVGRWEISKDGSSWSPDFALTYRRVT